MSTCHQQDGLSAPLVCGLMLGPDFAKVYKTSGSPLILISFINLLQHFQLQALSDTAHL